MRQICKPRPGSPYPGVGPGWKPRRRRRRRVEADRHALPIRPERLSARARSDQSVQFERSLPRNFDASPACSRRRSFTKKPAVVSLLLTRGAKVDARDGFGRTALLIAASLGDAETARRLLDRGADVNATASMNFTPLHWAVGLGRRDLFNMLIDLGADVNALSIHGESPLHLAAM